MSNEPTIPVTITIFRNATGKSWRWRYGNDASPKQYMSKAQARQGALKACPSATLVDGEAYDDVAQTVDAVMQGNLADGITVPEKPKQPEPAAVSRSRTKGRGRVSMTTKADRDTVQEAIADLETSVGHIAFGRNGTLYEIFYREHNGSPAAWKAKASTTIDADGYRSAGATLLHTGVDAIRTLVKTSTGKNLSQVGISIAKQATDAAGDPTEPTAPKAPRQRPTGETRVSLIDAAAQVLAGAEPMGCRDIVAKVIEQGLWSSPKGKTPDATLYSAIIREIKVKGDAARFVKAAPGKFAGRAA